MAFFNVSEIPGPTRWSTTPVDEEDYNDQFGSAEQDNTYGTSNNVLERFRESIKKGKNKTGNLPKGTAASTQKDKKAHSGSTTLYILHLFPILLMVSTI